MTAISDATAEKGVLVQLKVMPCEQGDNYRELLLIQEDLDLSLKAALLWCEEYEEPSSVAEQTVGNSLSIDALMRFVSCFRHSGNPGLDPDGVYASKDDGKREYFDYLKSIRDTYIGHRFGPLRQAEPFIEIHHETGELMRIVGCPLMWKPSVEQIGVELVQMIQCAQEHVDVLIKNATQDLVKILQAMSPEERLALPDGRMRVPGPEDFRKPRKAYQAKHGVVKIKERADPNG